MNYKQLSALETAKLIHSGEVTSTEVTRQVLDMIDNEDKKYNAFITVCHDKALCQAAAADKRIRRGDMLSPLDGVPIAVKDNICTRGIRTTCASKMLENYIPPYDAAVVEMLNNAGMVIVGKTNLDEFAMGSSCDTSYFDPTHNPWDISRIPGGSSGGSCASVAARLVPMALGSDTGGSVRQPAAMCGVCGMKPTYGAVSRYGLVAYASSLDQVGVVGHNAADCAALLDIISGKDGRDSTYTGVAGGFSHKLSDSVSGKKIGIPEECIESGIDEEVKSAFLAAVDVMRLQGCTVEFFSFPMLKFVIPCYYVISNAEASTNLSRFDGVKYGYRASEYDNVTDMIIKSRSEGFGLEVKKRIMLGTLAIMSENYEKFYKKAIEAKRMLSSVFEDSFKKYDMIMCPTSPSTAGKLGVTETDTVKMYLSDIFTVSANITGLPAISVPCGFDTNGLPVGMQFMGKHYDDASVLNFAAAYQTATNWHTEIPKEAVCNV